MKGVLSGGASGAPSIEFVRLPTKVSGERCVTTLIDEPAIADNIMRLDDPLKACRSFVTAKRMCL